MADDPTPDDFMRYWTTDAQGNRVRRGLTAQETAEYTAYQETRRRERETGVYAPTAERDAARDRFLELDAKHERARIAALMAENELRVDKPTLN